MGMGEFILDDYYIYNYGQESLRRNGITSQSTKTVQNAVLGCNPKNDRIILVHFQGRPFSITVIQVYALTINVKEGEVDWFYKYLQDLLKVTTIKKMPLFILGDWNAKVGSQEIPGVTGKLSLEVQNEARQRLAEFCQENVLVMGNSLPTTEEMTLHMDITRWSITKSDWFYSLQLKMEKMNTISKNKMSSSLWTGSWTPFCKIQT